MRCSRKAKWFIFTDYWKCQMPTCIYICIWLHMIKNKKLIIGFMSINKDKDRYFKERRRKDEENKEWKKLSDFSPIQFFPLFLFQHFYSYFSAFSMFLSNKLISTITSKLYSILSLLFLFTFFFSFSFKTFFLLKNSIFSSLSTKSQSATDISNLKLCFPQ